MKMLAMYIALFIFFPDDLLAQIDSTRVQTDSNSVKEAPEALINLLESIAEEEKERANNGSELEIDGLLIDETKTKSGRDFFEYFYRQWEAPEEANNYSIFIREKPFRLSTTMIEIYINETMVFQSLLQPRNEVVEQLVSQSIGSTYMYLARYEEIVRELAGEERSGSGIF
ncbi:curli production assembly/transport protein CsgE [Cyclobacterium lianum]|nr:curli production assembly/transport protein CsgE [Cyclobacterium lianum]